MKQIRYNAHHPYRIALSIRRTLRGAYPEKTYEISLGLLHKQHVCNQAEEDKNVEEDKKTY